MTKKPLYYFTGAALACLAALAGLTLNRWPGEEPQRVTLGGPETDQGQPAAQPKAELNAPAGEEKPAEVTEKIEKPEFDTVRIEANGEAIVAGRAEPGSEVSLTIDGKVIGKGKANEEGAWVVVPDAPLPKGTSEIMAEQKSADSQAPVASEQSIAVAIAENGTTQPLIIISEPGQATKLVQKPEPEVSVALNTAGDNLKLQAPPKPDMPSDLQAPAGEKAPEPAITEKAPEPADTKADAAQTAEKAPEPQIEKAPEPAASEKADTKESQEEQQIAEAAPEIEAGAQTGKAPELTELPQENAQKNVVEKAPEPAPADAKADADKTPEQVIASAPEPEKTDPIPLSLDVVDYNDKGDITFSGRAEPGTAVRLYVDNSIVGDAIVASSGQWSFAGDETIAPGTHQLRADQIDSTGKVISRVELPFQREKPEAVAALEQPAPEPKPEQQEPAATEPVQSAQPEQPAQPEQSAAIEPPDQQIEAAPAKPELVPDVSAKVDAQSGAASEAAAKPRTGRVVIQPGNNLWKLSRVIYGRGVNYTVIYSANKEQIRDPDLIYPGQIFAIPNAEPPETIDPKRREPLSSAEGGTAIE